MTQLTWQIPPIGERAIVVTFDIRSSSLIVDDLLLTGQIALLDALVRDLKHELAGVQSIGPVFRLYKFLGDGWILLYDDQTSGLAILNQLSELTRRFLKIIEPLRRRMELPPPETGLTFGIDVGDVRCATIFQTKEWLGRPLNISSRLQGAASVNSALVSNTFHGNYLDGRQHTYLIEATTRDLKNVRGGEGYPCHKISLVS